MYGCGRACARARGRVRQETGVVEAFIAGTRGWLRWNASRLISRNIIYRLSCPYVARTARYNTYKHTWKRVYTRARAHNPATIPWLATLTRFVASFVDTRGGFLLRKLEFSRERAFIIRGDSNIAIPFLTSTSVLLFRIGYIGG